MNLGKLIFRNLRFYARAHLGVMLGAAIGSAALIGALVVGDSVRGTLRDAAFERLGSTHFVLNSNDRLFGDDLADRLRMQLATSGPPAAAEWRFATLLAEPANAVRPDAEARANQVHLYGYDRQFGAFAEAPTVYTNLGPDGVLVNDALAKQLNVQVGDALILRSPKNTALSRDAVVSPRADQAVAMRLIVRGVAPPSALGNFSLVASQIPAMNAFVPLQTLQRFLNATNQANLLLAGRGSGRLEILEQALQRSWQLSDAQLEFLPVPGTSELEIRSRRVFLDDPIQKAALSEPRSMPLLTYLVTLLGHGSNSTPYSMITAGGGPYTPTDLRDDEILLNQWLADDLRAKSGDQVSLVYFDPESGARLVERTNFFRVHSIVPMTLPWADRTLLPDFPGIEKAESTHDWDAGFPLVYKIRPKDEEYWKKYRGTPKAFVSLAAGQKMWGNRFGNLTAVRLSVPEGKTGAPQDAAASALIQAQLRARLHPGEVGLQFQAARDQALRAAEQGQDFGGLFIGFSFFLVVAALLLMSVLFQFGLEQRAVEVGIFLALGFTPRRLRWMLLVEALVLAVAGAGLGLFGGIYYAKAMLWGLATIWRDAIGQSSIHFHASLTAMLTGAFSGIAVAVLTIWLTLRKQARQPAQQLLAGEADSESMKIGRVAWAKWSALLCLLSAFAMLAWSFITHAGTNVEVFFGAGSLLLAGGLAAMAAWLRHLSLRRSADALSLAGLGVRTCARRRKRSLATAALLACGCFLIVSIGAFRLDANRDAAQKTSGTGGFALVGESTLPILPDLNTAAGRESIGLNESDLAQVHVVSFRVRDGDEASCLNLNRAQQPRLLGVKPESLAGRFTFVNTISAPARDNAWGILHATQQTPRENDEVAAIGDANSIQWALGKKVGDVIDYTDERGRKVKIRLVGAVANSILQGSLIIDEAEFVRLFPSESGHRFFLLDAAPNSAREVSAVLTRALQDFGLQISSAPGRLNAFNAVQNTYLQTFQILGGLGLLLGSAGLGVVVLRNVLERRGELGVLMAVGYQKKTLLRLLLVEHGALLASGLGIGLIAALVAVFPALTSPGRQLPYFSLSLTLLAILLNGVIWTWLAARVALRGDLLAALRNE